MPPVLRQIIKHEQQRQLRQHGPAREHALRLRRDQAGDQTTAEYRHRLDQQDQPEAGDQLDPDIIASLARLAEETGEQDFQHHEGEEDGEDGEIFQLHDADPSVRGALGLSILL